MFLLDTNVLSETRRNKPHGGVIAWLSGHPAHSLFVSAVSLGEIQARIEITRRQDAARAAQLQAWADRLASTMQILPMGAAEFREFARLMNGRSVTLIYDAMIAATARTHGLQVVTRNTADFKSLGLKSVNPFNHR